MLAACARDPQLPTSTSNGVALSTLPKLRVYHNPYANVLWETDFRLKTQLHDHVGASPAGIRAYDSAGYDIMSLMQYSGVASLAYTWRERHWPPQKWLPANLLQSLAHIKFFIPNGEEVGYFHVVSPLMTSYIAKYEPEYDSVFKPWNYGGPTTDWVPGSQEEISLVKSLGGFAIVAHPFDAWMNFATLHDYDGIEMYSAYVAYKQWEGLNPFFANDRNVDMEANWDRALALNDRVVGIAVNDHFGPDNMSVPPRIRDSGKIIVLAHGTTYDAFAAALRAGEVLAVRDVGDIKDRFPQIVAIQVSDRDLRVATDGDITWVANGKPFKTGAVLEITNIPAGSTYVRAVIKNSDSSAVYTQAFSIRALMDSNGDGVVDEKDAALCKNVEAGKDPEPDHVRACDARRAARSASTQDPD